MIHKGKAGEVYNVGGHNEKTNLEIVKLTIRTIRQLMEEEPQYRNVLKKKEMGADGQLSIDWINDETSFETGIVKTIRWYLENQAWVEDITGGDYMQYYERMYKGREL